MMLLLLSGCSKKEEQKQEEQATQTTATITYVYGDKEIREELTPEESAAILTMMLGKSSYTVVPSCSFSEDISVTVGGVTLAPARDYCNIVKNMNTGKYINLTSNERTKLNEIFKNHGGKFPCV